MNDNKSLVPVTQETWAVIKEIAPVAFASRMFGVTEEQAMVVMLKGHELGLGLASAFEFIHVIDQKPSISPKGALALIHQSGELDSLKIEDLTDNSGNPTRCRVTMRRSNGFEYTTEFSMDDAKRAGVVRDKSGWTKYPANMLRWRAVGYCADVVFPDVVGGLYRPEELGADVNADGEPEPSEQWSVVNKDSDGEQASTQSVSEANSSPIKANVPEDAENTTETPQEAPEEEEEPESEAKIENLVDLRDAGYTPQQIMEAHGGSIPGTPEECQAVFEKLEADK